MLLTPVFSTIAWMIGLQMYISFLIINEQNYVFMSFLAEFSIKKMESSLHLSVCSVAAQLNKCSMRRSIV